MSNDWIDVSLPLHNGMVHWPGDARFERKKTLAIADGDACNLSEIRGSAHTGTHMDAPLHFIESGAGMDAMPLDATIGRARVIEIRDPRLIRIEELQAHRPSRGDRLLFKTANSRLWKIPEFQTDFVHIPPDTARYLAGAGVRTVGIDYLSVGHGEGGGAETHRILLQAGIWIIEGLDLEKVIQATTSSFACLSGLSAAMALPLARSCAAFNYLCLRLSAILIPYLVRSVINGRMSTF